MLRSGKRLARVVDEQVYDKLLAAAADVTGNDECMYSLLNGPLAHGKCTAGLTPEEHRFLREQAGCIVYETSDNRKGVTYYPGGETWAEEPGVRLAREWADLVKGYSEPVNPPAPGVT